MRARDGKLGMPSFGARARGSSMPRMAGVSALECSLMLQRMTGKLRDAKLYESECALRSHRSTLRRTPPKVSLSLSAFSGTLLNAGRRGSLRWLVAVAGSGSTLAVCSPASIEHVLMLHVR